MTDDPQRPRLLIRAAPADREWPIWVVGALYLLATVAYVVLRATA